MFTHALVTKPSEHMFMMSTDYMIGTFAECARYALKHGLRSVTDIIPF